MPTDFEGKYEWKLWNVWLDFHLNFYKMQQKRACNMHRNFEPYSYSKYKLYSTIAFKQSTD